VVVKIRRNMKDKAIQQMKEEHNANIWRLRKEYEGHRKSFNKKVIKMQCIVSRAKEAKGWE
jgi:hypothetical protein